MIQVNNNATITKNVAHGTSGSVGVVDSARFLLILLLLLLSIDSGLVVIVVVKEGLFAFVIADKVVSGTFCGSTCSKEHMSITENTIIDDMVRRLF